MVGIASGLCSSKRERRLWAWTLVVAGTIYATLGVAPLFVGHVPEEVLEFAFFACLLLVAAMVLSQGFRVQPRGVDIGVVVGIVCVYVLLGVRMAVPERSHLMEYGVLAMLVYEALSERVANGRRVLYPSALAVLATSCVGGLDEAIQVVLPGRVFDWQDIVFNVLAAVTAIAGVGMLRRVRRWSALRRDQSGSHRRGGSTC